MIAASSSRTLNNSGVTSPPRQHLDATANGAGGFQRYRRGVSLMSLTGNSVAAKDEHNLREALLRHGASVSRLGTAINHLQPVDRHALASRSHFRPDPSADALAQHLKWSSTGQVTFNENEVLSNARDTYHPTATPAPPMHVTIRQIQAKSGANIHSSTQHLPQMDSSPTTPRPESQPNGNYHHVGPRQGGNTNNRRFVSVENRPATTTAVRRSASNFKHTNSAAAAPSAPSTPRLQPGSADLKKQYDSYQRGAQFLPQSTSTKYFYRPEHGWLVKNARDRRQAATSLNNIGSATSLSSAQQLQANGSSAESNGNLATSLEVSKLVSPGGDYRILKRPTKTNQQQQRLISATSMNKISASSSAPYVTVVDLSTDQEYTGDESNDVKRVSAKNHSATTSRVSSSGYNLQQHQASAMIVTSKQHPAAVRAKKLRDMFASYDDFKRAAEDYATNFPKLPQNLTCSPYLNEAKQRQIWCWLHYGENISDVEYLLSVC